MKQTLYCGIVDNSISEEEKAKFINMMSDNGKYDVIFDENNLIPNLVQLSLPYITPFDETH